MFEIGDKVVYNRNPVAPYFHEYSDEHEDIEGHIFEVQGVEYIGNFYNIRIYSDYFGYDQIVDSKNLKLYKEDK